MCVETFDDLPTPVVRKTRRENFCRLISQNTENALMSRRSQTPNRVRLTRCTPVFT